MYVYLHFTYCCPARALRVLGVLLADGALTAWWGGLLSARARFFYENGRNSETKSRKIDPKVRNELSFQGLQAGHGH